MTKNYSKNILTILIWDFNKNIEKGSYQIVPSLEDHVGNHVVKGMNYKMNYYIDQHFLLDLEHNIPIRQSNVNQNLDPGCVNYSK